MKKLCTLVFLSLCLLMACKGPKDVDPAAAPAPQNPAAFEDKESSRGLELVSKKRYDDNDMVNDLYEELLEKDSALNQLEKSIDIISSQQSDSIQPFNSYDLKNASYYNSVKNHLQSITDSGLKQKMKSLIDKSLDDYNGSIAKHERLIDLLKSKDIDIRNLHVVLKIVKTLPMAEKYQTENLPSTGSMEKMLANYIRLIRQAETLSKTN